MRNPYQKYILPKVTDYFCAVSPVTKQRQKVIPRAAGSVLEIGIGTGLNLPFYQPSAIKTFYALDPSKEMWQIAMKNQPVDRFPLQFIEGTSEHIPIDTHTIDSVVVTYTLCSIDNLNASFREIRRILKPDGRLFFCEHGIAPDRSIRQQQRLIGPLWKLFGGGCRLTRDIPALLKAGGFSLHDLQTMYIPGPRFASYNYWGSAKVNPAHSTQEK